MNRQMFISTVLAFVLIGVTGVLLNQVRDHQVLAPPGVKTHSVPGSIRLEADLPERVLEYDSQWVETDKVTLSTLPKDTSFGQRHYKAPDGFELELRVVLMGRDRTSMHKPQFCLTGQGWQIDDLATTQTRLRVHRPFEYDLPIVELVARKVISVESRDQTVSGVYVYWYVADDALSATTLGVQRMLSMATKLLRTGVLQRWAYVSCFAPCYPGQEEATFNRMKEFIPACVPEFQLYPGPKPVTVSAIP
jgi:hypothetical protein